MHLEDSLFFMLVCFVYLFGLNMCVDFEFQKRNLLNWDLSFFTNSKMLTCLMFESQIVEALILNYTSF
jgi:hypothetical protein